ncbi:CDC45 family [Paraphysoderma sedebokerense]|nr:CDC45 family [Paraphysoderma sedebokerense]
MVVQSIDSYEQAYSQIREHAQSNSQDGAQAVLLFVANDVDAVCACKIIVSLLKADYIPYNIVPVASYSDLAEYNEKLIQPNEELQSVIFINCGGLVDLSELLDIRETLYCYVFDSHRPLNLTNLWGSSNIIVFDDGEIENDMGEIKDAWIESMYDVDDDEDSDSEGDSDGEDEADEEMDSDEESSPPDHDSDTEMSSSKENSPPNSPSSPKSKKRKRPKKSSGESRREKRVKRAQAQTLILDYYQGGYYFGFSVAEMAFLLCDALDRVKGDTVWLAILGLTDQYIHHRISHTRYLQQTEVYQTLVRKYFPTPPTSSTSNATSSTDPDLDDPSLEPMPTNGNAHSTEEDLTISGVAVDPGKGYVKFEAEELRFIHYRHWNLYDSLIHSDYVCCRVSGWNEKGKSRVRNMLAKMGMPFKQSLQLHHSLPSSIKSSLPKKLVEIGPQYNLPNITFPSFTKSYGFNFVVSASDVVYAVSALLEASCRGWEGLEGGVGLGLGFGGGMGDEEDGTKVWERGWFAGYDALDDRDLLLHGISLSRHLHSCILRTATSLIENQSVKTMKGFRFVLIKDGPDIGVFGNEGRVKSLERLGTWVGGVVREMKRMSTSQNQPSHLPLVVAVYNAHSQTFMVMAHMIGMEWGVVRRNIFPLAFQSTTSYTSARVKHDAFESWWLEINKDDLVDWVERLCVEIARVGY